MGERSRANSTAAAAGTSAAVNGSQRARGAPYALKLSQPKLKIPTVRTRCSAIARPSEIP
jgi:hypothetical protein